MESERGSATVLVISMMVLLSMLGATLLTLSKTDIQIASNHRDGLAAQYLAEAGIQHMVTQLKTDQNLVNQTEYDSYTATSQSLAIRPESGSYTVKIEPNSKTTKKNQRQITAIGKVHQAARQVVVTVTLPTGGDNSFVMIWEN